MTIGTYNGDNTRISNDLAQLQALINQGVKDPTNPATNAQIAQLLNDLKAAASDLDKLAYGAAGPDQASALQEITKDQDFINLFGTDTSGKGLVGGDFNSDFLFVNGEATAASVNSALNYLGEFPDTLTTLNTDESNYQVEHPVRS